MNRGYLYDQYVLSIVNDRQIYAKLKDFLECGYFNKFAFAVDDYCKRIADRFGLTRAEELRERRFIQATVLNQIGERRHVENFVRRGHFGFKTFVQDLFDFGDQDLAREVLKAESYLAAKEGKFGWQKNPFDPFEQDSQAAHNETTPSTIETKEETMSKVTISTITYVNGSDVTKLTDEQLIEAIKQIEGEIEDLGKVKTESKKVAAKIEGLKKTLTEVVAILDAR